MRKLMMPAILAKAFGAMKVKAFSKQDPASREWQLTRAAAKRERRAIDAKGMRTGGKA